MASYLGRKAHDKDYGLGEHAFDADRLGVVDEQELTERLIRTFSAPGYQPPRLPAVAMELMTLSQKPDVEFPEIESLLEQDAMLAGEIVAVARSAHFSGHHQVSSLRQALIRLGLNKLRQVVMQASMNMRVFRSATYGDCMERIRQHSRNIAHLSGIVSRYTPFPEEESFFCGLLHDVGIAGILLMLGDVGRGKKAPDLTVLWPAIHGAHPAAGRKMIELWGLPGEIATVVGAHHQVDVDGVDHPVAAVICTAESLSVDLGLHFVPPGATAAPRDEAELAMASLLSRVQVDSCDAAIVARAHAALGLDEGQLDLIRADTRKWLASENAGSVEA